MTTIWQCLASFEKQIDAGNDAVKEEELFHIAIAEASDNPYFVRFVKYVGSGLTPLRKIITKFVRSFSSPNYSTQLKQEYRNIAQAIDDMNIDSARDFTRAYFYNNRERYLKIIKEYSVSLGHNLGAED